MDAEKKNPYEVVLSKPYKFENKQYTSLDFSKVVDLKGSDIMEAERYVNRMTIVAPSAEITGDFAFYLAAIVLGQPLEFFNGLPATDALRVRRSMRRFLFV